MFNMKAQEGVSGLSYSMTVQYLKKLECIKKKRVKMGFYL